MRNARFVRQLALGLSMLLFGAAAQAKDPRLAPKRLSSVGDSITEAINAEEYNPFNPVNPNRWASWANGYHGFWEWLLGRTDVNSHNQRITRNFGSTGRVNYMEARSGSDSFDVPYQASQSVAHTATYVPVLMGHNDACQGSFAQIPTDAQFEANVRAGLDGMKAGLPAGATVYLVGIVDVYRLWAIGSQLSSLGILDCRAIWATSLLSWYPCATMLSPLNSEADRQYTRSRIVGFNAILKRLASEYETADARHYYAYTDAAFQYVFSPSQVSGFDCFHPSATGQAELSRATWAAGPFGAYTR